MVYQRAKGTKSDEPFGTLRDVTAVGYEFLRHSMRARLAEKMTNDNQPRVRLGGPDCQQPYDIALLNVSAMSFGALSANAIESLNGGAAKVDSPTTPAKAGSAHITSSTAATSSGRSAPVISAAATATDNSIPDIREEGRVPVGQSDFHQALARRETRLGGVLPARGKRQEIAATRGVPSGQTVGVAARTPPSHSPRTRRVHRHTAQTFRR